MQRSYRARGRGRPPGMNVIQDPLIANVSLTAVKILGAHNPRTNDTIGTGYLALPPTRYLHVASESKIHIHVIVTLHNGIIH